MVPLGVGFFAELTPQRPFLHLDHHAVVMALRTPQLRAQDLSSRGGELSSPGGGFGALISSHLAAGFSWGLHRGMTPDATHPPTPGSKSAVIWQLHGRYGANQPRFWAISNSPTQSGVIPRFSACSGNLSSPLTITGGLTTLWTWYVLLLWHDGC